MIDLVASTMDVKSQLVESHVVFVTPVVKNFMLLVGPKRSLNLLYAILVLHKKPRTVCVIARGKRLYMGTMLLYHMKRCQAIEQFFRRFGAID